MEESAIKVMEVESTVLKRSASMEKIIISKEAITYTRNVQINNEVDPTKPVGFLRRKPNPDFLQSVL